MKKTSDNKDIKKSLFSRKKNEFEYEMKDRGVRHIEDAASFLNETNELIGEYGQAEDLADKWGLSRKDSNMVQKTRVRALRFVAAFLVTVIIIVSVFKFLPAVLPGFFKGTNIELFVEKPVNRIYTDSSYRVVKEVAVSLMSEPNPASTRITQVLYNEPVQMLMDDDGSGYMYVRTSDSIEGYILSSSVIEDTDSVEPDLHEYKLVVSESSKNIMTHASQGTLITQVAMNTVLYADVKRDGVYQVYLPGGGTGWIGSSGVIEIGVREDIEQVSCRYFVSSALSLVNSMYIEGGITKSGMSINGLVYVCSCVNGITMPRTVEGQLEMGSPVTLDYDVVTGELIIDSIIPGDILFLKSPLEGAGEEVYEMAICTDTGTLLMVSSARTTIRLVSFNSRSNICDRILAVRRVFS